MSRTDQLVDKFLRWSLPASVCSDPCATMAGYPHRTGTNLLNAVEARQMIVYLMGPAIAPPPRGNTKGWAHHNPDTGPEWSVNHPVESGECEDATGIVRMTLAKFRRQYPLDTKATQ